jgi:hypothetical protein
MNHFQTLVERILAEGPIGLAEGALFVGNSRPGKPCHPSTLGRWGLRGVKRKDGTTVKLEIIRVGTVLKTSRQAIVRFLEALQDQPAAPAPRSATERGRAAARADRALDELGI